MLAGEKTASVGMTAVEIDNILATPELHELVESAEQTGSLRYADLAEVLEVLRLDPLETDAASRSASRSRRQSHSHLRRRSPSSRRRRRTRCSSSCATPAAIRC